MPDESHVLAEIRNTNREMADLKQSVREMSQAVLQLVQTSVRYEEKLTHIEDRMERDIKSQGDQLTNLTGELRELREDIAQITNVVKTLQDDYNERMDGRKWLVREITAKLIWPLLAIIATALLVYKG